MRTGLRMAALFLVLGVIAYWFFSGANRGFNKSYVIEMRKEPITGLEYPAEVKRFVPGAEFVGMGLGGAALLVGCSFFFRKTNVSKRSG